MLTGCKIGSARHGVFKPQGLVDRQNTSLGGPGLRSASQPGPGDYTQWPTLRATWRAGWRLRHLKPRVMNTAPRASRVTGLPMVEYRSHLTPRNGEFSSVHRHQLYIGVIAATRWQPIIGMAVAGASIAIKKVDGGSQRPRDGLDEGWGRHARRARPAHGPRGQRPCPSLACPTGTQALHSGRTEKRGPLTQG
jgi:hypothetical protein